jgi:coenzyme F420-reducing hydrogenase delta subunit
MKIRSVGPVDVAAADALERGIEGAIAAGSCHGEHGAASYQRGEQMAKGSICVLVFAHS